MFAKAACGLTNAEAFAEFPPTVHDMSRLNPSICHQQSTGAPEAYPTQLRKLWVLSRITHRAGCRIEGSVSRHHQRTNKIATGHIARWQAAILRLCRGSKCAAKVPFGSHGANSLSLGLL